MTRYSTAPAVNDIIQHYGEWYRYQKYPTYTTLQARLESYNTVVLPYVSKAILSPSTGEYLKIAVLCSGLFPGKPTNYIHQFVLELCGGLYLTYGKATMIASAATESASGYSRDTVRTTFGDIVKTAVMGRITLRDLIIQIYLRVLPQVKGDVLQATAKVYEILDKEGLAVSNPYYEFPPLYFQLFNEEFTRLSIEVADTLTLAYVESTIASLEPALTYPPEYQQTMLRLRKKLGEISE